MKTKPPKCIKCKKVMKRIYTKESYKYNNKYKTYWHAIGWSCNHIYYPYVIIDWHKERFGIKQLIDIYDIDLFDLLKALKNIKIY